MLLMGIDTSALKDSDVHLLRFLLRAVPLGLVVGAIVGLPTWAAVDLILGPTSVRLAPGTAWVHAGRIGILVWGAAAIVAAIVAFIGSISLIGKACENVQKHYAAFKNNTPIEGRD